MCRSMNKDSTGTVYDVVAMLAVSKTVFASGSGMHCCHRADVKTSFLYARASTTRAQIAHSRSHPMSCYNLPVTKDGPRVWPYGRDLSAPCGIVAESGQSVETYADMWISTIHGQTSCVPSQIS